MSPEFAAIARDEGFPDRAGVFMAIGVAEKQHEKRSLDLMVNIKRGRVFKRENKVTWRCRNCGYLHHGPEAPEKCLACAHPRDHFKLHGENW